MCALAIDLERLELIEQVQIQSVHTRKCYDYKRLPIPSSRISVWSLTIHS